MSARVNLTPSQTAALTHVREYARERGPEARSLLTRVLGSAGVHEESLDDALAALREHARVILHFHPDRLRPDGRAVVEDLCSGGIYRSQFETHISNGSVSAHPGGDRDRWESGLYGGAYNLPGSGPAQRPKYGALDLLRHAEGPAPRFGSCYLVLRSSVSERCTYSYQDSHLDPKERGTLDQFDDVLSALLAEVHEHGSALGEPELTVPKLLTRLSRQLEAPYSIDPLAPVHRNLDAYIEAQVHGDVRLREDGELLVADPSFLGTETGVRIEETCDRWKLDLQWHGGFVMSARDTSAEFRGPTMPSLARRVAIDGRVDAHAIGLGVRSLREDPESWRDRGDLETVLQELKQLWHVLLNQGEPAANA